MQMLRKRSLLVGALVLALLTGCLAGWVGLSAWRSVTVRQPNAYAMQCAGQLIVGHMRLHSGAWPRDWADLRNTCAVTGAQILATNADDEIQELKKRVEIDWGADPETIRRSIVPVSVVRLRSGRRDWFVGAEPNRMIAAYLKQTTEPGGAANRSQPVRSETNSSSAAAGSGR